MSAGNEREICRTWLSMLTQAPQRRFAEGRDFEHGSVKGRHEGCYDVWIVYVCRRQACSIVSWVEGGAAIKGSLLRCKAAQDRVDARQKVKTPQLRTKFSFAEGGAVTTRVAVDIYWFGFDWALRVDKAAWAGGLSWAGLPKFGYGISHYGGALCPACLDCLGKAKYLVLVGQSK